MVETEGVEAPNNMYPKIIFVGTLPSPTDILIGAENTKLVELSGNLKALCNIVVLFYILNLHYPKKVFNTYMYIQTQILGEHDSVTSLTKRVITFVNEV